MYLFGFEGWKKLVIRIFILEGLNNIMYNIFGKSFKVKKCSEVLYVVIYYFFLWKLRV